MVKFKIGDKVKVVSSGWNTSSKEIGQIYTVRKVDKLELEHVYYFEEPRPRLTGSDKYACESGLKLVSRPKVTNWREELQ